MRWLIRLLFSEDAKSINVPLFIGVRLQFSCQLFMFIVKAHALDRYLLL
jgi:hypothetical protein